MHILIIEDDLAIAANLYDFLESRGHSADAAANGIAGLHLAVTQHFDGILLDLGLPGMSGIALCRKLREEEHVDTPVLMLTARDTLEDKLEGFENGADDYLVKPFAFDELMARVRALLRRAQPAQPQVYRFADLELDTGTRQGRRGGQTFDLTAKEYELLELFMRHPRQVLTRDVIFDRVWDYDFGGESNIIEVYVRYLRQKTEEGDLPRLIHTVRGIGYVLRDETAA